jgi:hypothetical protein
VFYGAWLDSEDRLNYRASLVAAYIANTAPRGRGRRKAIDPHDIIPPLRDITQTEEINSVDDQVNALKMIFGESAFTQETTL